MNMKTNIKVLISYRLKKANELAKLVTASVASGNTEETGIKIVFDKTAGSYSAYVDSVSAENKIGFCHEIDDLAVFEKIIMNDYSCSITIENGVQYSITLTAEITADDPSHEAEVIIDLSAYESEIVRVSKAGYCTREEAERNIRVMIGLRVPEKLIRKVLARYRKYGKSASVPKTIYVDPKKKGPSVFAECVLMALSGYPCIYEGDKSVGKNMCVETLAMVFNMPFYQITFSKYMNPEDIYGAKVTDNSAASRLTRDGAMASIKLRRGNDKLTIEDCNNAIDFELAKAQAASVQIIQEESELVKWLRSGGVMCFNEMNLIEPNFFASFANTLTDGSKYINIPGIGDIEKPAADMSVLVGTQNSTDYLGTSNQNEATISRFGCIQFSYPDSVKEQLKAAVGAGKLTENYFEEVDSLYKVILESVHGGIISNTALNIRGFVRALNCVYESEYTSSLKRQIMINVINTAMADERGVLETLLLEHVTL